MVPIVDHRAAGSGFDPRARASGQPHPVELAALILTLAALALRLWHLEFQSLWWDEGVSIYLSGVGLRELTIAKDFGVDLHPPGYHLALAIWRVFLGPSVFSDRLFSVFCGTITAPLIYVFVRQIRRVEQGIRQSAEPASNQDGIAAASIRAPAGGAAPVLAALLVTVSPIDVYYSQETRMYALLPVVGLLSMIFTTRLLATGKRHDWLLWIVVNAAGLYTYYYLGLLTAAEALALLWPAIRRRQVLPWIASQMATIALFLPWAVLMIRRLGGSALALPAETAVHLTPATYLLENWQAFTVGFSRPPGARWLLVVFAVVALAGAIVLLRRSPWLFALLVLSVVVPLAGAGVVLLVRPFFYPRFILFAALPIWTFVAIGLTAQRRLWPLATVVVVAILAGNGWTWYYERTTPRVGYAPDDYRVVFTTLASSARPGDVVLCGYPWQVGYVEAYLWTSGLRAAFLPGRPAPERVDDAVGAARRAWVYEYSPDHQFAGNWLSQMLASRDRTLVVDQYGDSRVRLFAPDDGAANSQGQPRATLGREIALLSSQVQAARPARPGDSVQITLRWRALATPARSYTVFVHLLGPGGKVAAQRDSPPLNGGFPTDRWTPGETIVDRYALAIPAQASPGIYTVEIGMYQPDTGQRLAVGPTPDKDNRIVIGEVSVGS